MLIFDEVLADHGRGVAAVVLFGLSTSLLSGRALVGLVVGSGGLGWWCAVGGLECVDPGVLPEPVLG